MTDFEKVCDFENLYKAYKKAKAGKGYRNSAAQFEVRALDGIHRLKQQLESKEYQIANYNSFYVYEPKQRLIEAASFKDKVVQHSLCDNVLLPRFQNVFIRNNFAGQKGKGTLFGLNTLKEQMQAFYNEHGFNGYILKADVTKFFYTIDHDIVKALLRKYFDDADLLWLCDAIIDSTEGFGLPLGNQSSQVFALMYLHELDSRVALKTGTEYYGRYMDDFYLIHQDKIYLKQCLIQIEKIIHDLNLTLNGKTQIMPFKQGIKFLGFHTYIKDGKVLCRIRNENKRNAYRKYKKMAKLVVDGKIELSKFQECYQSWKAHAAFGDCEGIVKSLDTRINQILGVEMHV